MRVRFSIGSFPSRHVGVPLRAGAGIIGDSSDDDGDAPAVGDVVDDDEASVASFDECADRNVAAESVVASLGRQCTCKHRRCLDQFAEVDLMFQAVDHRQNWLALHGPGQVSV